MDAELSLRRWRQHQNYYQFVPLVLQYNVPHDLLEAQEQTFIQHFQPKLNHPHIAPHMKRAFRGISQPARNKIQRRSGITSIWAKIRRRYLPPALRPLYSSHTFKRQAQVWQTICNLASNTRRRFDSTKELLKHKTPPAQLYAYHRIACNLPPTHQRPATKAINTAMRKRALPIPKNRRPAILPYLAHPSQTSTTRTFLRAQITTHQQHTLPLHPPTTTVVYARHPRVQTTFTTGDNSIGNGIHSSRPNAVANTSTRRTPPIYITATLPSLLPLWSHNTIFYITLAEALSFLPLNNFAETSSLQSRGGTRLITSQHPPTNTPQSQVLLRNNYSFMSST